MEVAEVLKGVPLPPVANPRSLKVDWAGIPVRGSVQVRSLAPSSSVFTLACMHGKRLGRKFKCRRLSPELVGVWRVK